MSEFGDGTPEPEGAPTGHKPPAARACDYCRQRKAGCSREKPQCRNCKNAKRICTYTDPVLRKENPAVKISGQLNTLGSRLSRIESLLPSLKESPSSHSSSGGLPDATEQRLSNIERHIEGINSKLDAIHALLTNFSQYASKARKAAEANGVPAPHTLERRWSESDHIANDGHEENPVGDSLLADDQGNIHYLGRSSNYSFTADAEILVQSRLKGYRYLVDPGATKGRTTSIRDSAQSSLGDGDDVAIEEWEEKETIDGEDEANLLSGMAVHLGDMHMGVDAVSSRERTAPTETTLSSDNPRLSETSELDRGSIVKYGPDSEFYIPTPEEEKLCLERIYGTITADMPLFCNMQPEHVIRQIYRNPQRFLANSNLDPSWVTIGYSLAYYGLGFQMNTDDEEQRRKELILKRNMARNAWASFKDLKVFLTPGIEHVQALMLLGVIAQDTSRPGLCWMLTCQACRLAQAMGLHRRVDPASSHGLSAADIELRKVAFWTLYVLDKSFSLTFGRTSCFQDYDCDVEVPKFSEIPPKPGMSPNELMACFHPNYLRALVELAKLQSSVYKKLYSAKGTGSKSRSCWMKETEKWVWELDARLRMWKEGLITHYRSLFRWHIPH
ncbi:fungal-specific transcription factor domain-containing protein [Kalaharituber pfeilii]|nr:fungal-specific transcription factor domain-containing protein [Kalaharituber pfeilii]